MDSRSKSLRGQDSVFLGQSLSNGYMQVVKLYWQPVIIFWIFGPLISLNGQGL